MQLLAENGIDIKTSDRTSGVIVTDVRALRAMDDSLAQLMADCGKVALSRARPHPTQGNLRLQIMGDEKSSTILATARFWRYGAERRLVVAPNTFVTEECASTGTMETFYESRILSRAESVGK